MGEGSTADSLILAILIFELPEDLRVEALKEFERLKEGVK